MQAAEVVMTAAMAVRSASSAGREKGIGGCLQNSKACSAAQDRGGRCASSHNMLVPTLFAMVANLVRPSPNRAPPPPPPRFCIVASWKTRGATCILHLRGCEWEDRDTPMPHRGYTQLGDRSIAYLLYIPTWWPGMSSAVADLQLDEVRRPMFSCPRRVKGS
jgi:hypothetical protein